MIWLNEETGTSHREPGAGVKCYSNQSIPSSVEDIQHIFTYDDSKGHEDEQAELLANFVLVKVKISYSDVFNK